MILPTHSETPITSPLGGASTGGPALTLTDLSAAQGIVHLRGAGATQVLTDRFGAAPSAVGEVITVVDRLLACLRPAACVLLLPAGGTDEVITHLEAAAGDAHITLTNLTHGRGQMRLSGEHAPDVLATLCGLDFSARAFPDHHAAQTSLAKVQALLVRHDAAEADISPSYVIIVDRSLAAYVWQALADAMQEHIP
jgi:sarcosine oxidase subunit gamma